VKERGHARCGVCGSERKECRADVATEMDLQRTVRSLGAAGSRRLGE
jgi:hypothetical protein